MANPTGKGGFKKGQSGNPAGKPLGTRNPTSLAVEKLLDGEAEALTRTAIEKAKEGDMVALRLCLERICPVRKSRSVNLDLPKVETAADVLAAFNAASVAMANGEIAIDELQALAAIFESKRRAIETVELEERVAAIEADSQASK